MESIDVLTGQHVTIAYKPANVFERGIATSLDWFIQFLYIMFLSIVMSVFGIDYYFHQNLFITIYLIFSIPVLFYTFFFEGIILNGQTPGKMILRLKVTKTDGTAISLGQHFLRWLLRPIDFFPFLGGVGIFVILYSKKKQRIGDLAADTIVVKTSGKINIGAEYYDFDETYRPVFPEVDELNDAQVRYIMSLLDLPEKYNREKLRDLAEKVKSVLKIDEHRMTDSDFLKRIVKDYNYTTSLGI